MNEPLPEHTATSAPPASPAPPTSVAPAASASASDAPAASRQRWWWLAGALSVLLALGVAWDARQRVRTLEKELVRRQQDTQTQAAEARLLARQAEDAARQAAARVALVDARVADATVQRTQVEDLLATLARSHEATVLADVDSTLRAAQQHAAITGSAEPMTAALKQADERLSRGGDERFERVRRAIARDLEQFKRAGGVDVATLAARLDEALRMVDDLPLLAQATDGRGRAITNGSAPVAAASAPIEDPNWRTRVTTVSDQLRGQVWDEIRSLVRVTRIDQPEAALLAPEQQYLLRQNLRLRLLNARLGLLSRQYATAHADLRDVLGLLDRHADRNARRVIAMQDLVRQVAVHATPVALPRPEETFTTLAAIAAGR